MTPEERAREIVRMHIGGIPARDRPNVQPALELSIAAAIAEAVAAEREACAQVADGYGADFARCRHLYGPADKDAGTGRQEGHIDASKEIAAAIRARGEKAAPAEPVREGR